jgi:ribosomal protein S18 acetylase RimI-like enzyme
MPMARSTKRTTAISSITANPVFVRPWQESDRPFLRTLFLHARREAWPWLNSEEWQLEDFDAVTRDEQIWVAVQNGHRVGFASVLPNDNFLHNLFVGPEHQGLGVGSVLLEQVQKTFTSTGALKCLVKNERAVAFYQRHGWHIEATGDSPEGEYYLMHYRPG